MTITTELDMGALHSWAPEFEELLALLGYHGSAPAIIWLTDSEWSQELRLLMTIDGHATAAEMWRKVLKENLSLPTPGLLLILEHMRRHPADMRNSLAAIGMGFSRTLANVAYRAADALYEGAKQSFASHEIDVAVARFREALSEFRFSIESQLLTDATRRMATGKYATAVAMIGRWIGVSHDAVSRALTYSKESMILGNQKPETLIYRLELLVQQFDQTGDQKLLRDALELLSENQSIAEDSELAEAEARFRLSLLSVKGGRDAQRYLKAARVKLLSFRPKNTFEEARWTVLNALVTEAERGQLTVPPKSMAIPRGILAQMAAEPSTDLWRSIRRVVDALEDLRRSKGSVAAAVLSARMLRQMIDGPASILEPHDLTRYVEITSWLSERASYSRHARWEAGAAALSVAKRTGNQGLAVQAMEVFQQLSATHPAWPLPLIGLARVQDYLSGPSNPESSSTAHWRDAATLALNSPVYARSNLGGRNGVFAVADARGFLSETFVFKRTTKAKAEHEASMLSALREEVMRQDGANKFEVPRSLAIVEVSTEDERGWVHVSQRAAGRLVSDLSAEEALDALDPIVDLLAIFHRVAGSPPAGKTAWRSMKDYLKMWSRTLFEPEQADRFVASLRDLFPAKLPLVRKRDGHASNWLVDPAGRIVAIDLESSDFIPMGYDVAQLIEDNALVQADMAGWHKRLEIMARYLNGVGQSLEDSALIAAYGWFALTRALRLGTEREAGKHLRRHARELCGLIIECGDEASKDLARELLQGLSRIEQVVAKDAVPTHDHRRLSKSMAFLLRHHGPEKGVSVDKAGFALMDEVANVLEVDSSQLLAVAEHPGEPRFEVKGDRIRALYGHSLDVVVDAGIKVGAPTSLYHGSSWTALDDIIRDGLRPMLRRAVHLTNVAEEAVAVGQRKGAPIVLSISQSNNEEPVAEGIWVAPEIPPQRLSIANPFYGEAGVTR